jgi:hypothetical protein
MGDQTQAYDIFPTPLSSGYPLPLSNFTKRTDNGGSIIVEKEGLKGLSHKKMTFMVSFRPT